MKYNNFVLLIEENILAEKLASYLCLIMPQIPLVFISQNDTEAIFNSKLIITNKTTITKGNKHVEEYLPPVLYVLNKQSDSTNIFFRPKDEIIFLPLTVEELRFRLCQIFNRKDIISFVNKFHVPTPNKVQFDILGNINHEIRTPLNAILGFAEHLKTNVNDQRNFNDSVVGIIRSGNEMLNILNKLLEITDCEGRQHYRLKQLISPEKLINEIQIAHNNIDINNNECNIFVHNNLPEWIITDGNLIKMILVSLIKFARSNTLNGKIEMIVGCENYNKNNQTINLYAKIIDNGKGMSKIQQKTLFNLSEIDYSNDTISDTDIGLPLIKKHLDYMGGTLNVVSKEGKGTYLKIIFTNLPVYDLQQISEINKDDIKLTGNQKTTKKIQSIANNILYAISDNCIELEMIKKDINKNLNPLFVKAAKSMFFDDLKIFAKEAIKTGEKFNILPLKEYGIYVTKMMEVYNIEIIPELLMVFPDFKNKLNNI